MIVASQKLLPGKTAQAKGLQCIARAIETPNMNKLPSFQSSVVHPSEQIFVPKLACNFLETERAGLCIRGCSDGSGLKTYQYKTRRASEVFIVVNGTVRAAILQLLHEC